MKNERIITHFLSYTTAQGCVKDLTSYFAGRISIAAAKTPPTNQSSNERNRFDEAEWVDDITEIGGIALGTMAVVVPGFSPVLPGGPAGGAVIGDVLGDYLETRIRNNQIGQQDEAVEAGPFYVAVDVFSEEEAVQAESIIRQHGGDPYRSGGNVPFSSEVTETVEPSVDEWKKKE